MLLGPSSSHKIECSFAGYLAQVRNPWLGRTDGYTGCFEKKSLFLPHDFHAVALFHATEKAIAHELNLGTLMWVPQVDKIAERMLCNWVTICPDLNQYRALTSQLDF